MTPQETIEQIVFKYRQMPNRGAALNISAKGLVDNGLAVVARFTSAVEARKALAAAGFVKCSYGWRLAQ